MDGAEIAKALEESSGGQPIELSILRDTAERLFRSKKVRCNFAQADAGLHAGLQIVIDDRLTLFFYKDEGAWQYDGWEVGDYKDYWQEGEL